MKITRFLMLIIPILIISACNFLNLTDSAEKVNNISYYSKKVEVSKDIDPDINPDRYDLQPVESRLYKSDGTLAVIFRYYYIDPDDSYSQNIFVNNRTNVFKVDKDGEETLIEYYKYEYYLDLYKYINDDEITVTGYSYIPSHGETYKADDTLVLYYDSTYENWGTGTDEVDPDNVAEARLTSTIDTKVGDPDAIIARHELTYIDVDGSGDRRYRTEKFYSLTDPTDTDTLALKEESARWYDTDAPYNYIYNLYHTIRSSDSSDGFYYYTSYSRNDNGDVYEQADWEYDSTGTVSSTPVPKGGDNSFTVDPLLAEPFVYDIEFDDIGAKATVRNREYDSFGNLTKEIQYLSGQVSEYTTYTYNSNSELTDKSRYTQGGTLLYDRTSIQYKDEYRDGAYYRVKEESTFKYYDN